MALVIIIGDFYQFFLITWQSLWTDPITEKEIHDKSIWNQFTSVITLIEQMRQYNNILFQEMLTKTRKGLLNIDDVTIQNSKVAVTISILNRNKDVVMVQQNAI